MRHDLARPSRHAHCAAIRLLASAAVPVAALLPLLLQACASASADLARREAVVVDSETGAPVPLPAFADALAGNDAVVLGEEHDNDAGHALQLRTIELLHERRPRLVIAMEMFERDVQPVLDRYLAGAIEEQQFLADARPWNNYAQHYRPVVEFARAQGLPVIAANLPRDLARKAAREGAAAVMGKPFAPSELRTPRDEYWKKFVEAMKDHPHAPKPPAKEPAAKEPAAEERAARETAAQNSEPTPAPAEQEVQEPLAPREREKSEDITRTDTATPEQDAAIWRMYEAQCLRDEAMAEAIVNWLDREEPASVERPLVVLLCGKTHADHRLGTVARLQRRRPDLDIAVVTMHESKTLAADTAGEAKMAGEWVALVPPQPQRLPPAVPPTSPQDQKHLAEQHALPEGHPPVRPPPASDDQKADEGQGAEGARPALGFMPDYEQGGEGVVVASLRPGGPAEQAGIREGDRIVRLGKVPVEDAITYSAALADLMPGQQVDVTVVRGDQERTFRVRVGTRIH